MKIIRNFSVLNTDVMKHRLLLFCFSIAAFLFFSGTCNAQKLTPEEREYRYLDTLRTVCGVDVSFPRGYTVDVEGVNWTTMEPSLSGKHGHPIVVFQNLIFSADGNMTVLLPMLSHHKVRRAFDMEREMAHYMTPEEIGAAIVSLDASRARRLFGADKVYYHEVPSGRTAFAYMVPASDFKRYGSYHPYQVMAEEKGWTFYRLVLEKDGYLPVAVLLALTPDGARDFSKSLKALSKVIHY